MAEFLRVLYEGVTEVTPDQLMGALMVGLLLALGCYGVCLLGRKRVADPLPLLCGLIFLVSTLSMAIGFGHSRYQVSARPGPIARVGLRHLPGQGHGRYPGRGEFGRSMMHPSSNPIGRILVEQADADRDGRLTPEEAARFVREADKDGDGTVDPSEIDRARPPISPPLANGNNPIADSPG